MRKYSHVPTKELEQRWLALRDEAARTGKHSPELYEMRMELERRRGWRPPVVDIDFTKNVPD